MSKISINGTALVVEPGDVLVIGISRMVSDWEADRMGKSVKKAIPSLKVMILDQVSALAVIKGKGRDDDGDLR